MLYSIIITILFIAAGWYIIYLIKKDKPRLERNEAIAAENKQLERQYQDLISQRKELSNQVNAKQNEFDSLTMAFQKAKDQLYQSSKLEADKEFDIYKDQLEQEYNNVLSGLMKETQEAIAKLTDAQSKQQAYIQAQIRKEAMLQQQDYYRLILSTDSLNDITVLRDLQLKISKKEAIDKIIWEVYYKPAYDALMPHLFKSNEKICGIYKITCINNDKSYIGQSVDIKTRFKDHIKSALEFGTKTNKLYSLMSTVGPENFTFEIIEEVPRAQLNERETYWIDMYQTKEYGLNKTAGGS